MKKAFLLLLLAPSFFAQAQSLKDALYSGKLKNDPGTVIRKGDDLTSKMDTTTHKATDDTILIKTNPVTIESSAKKVTAPTDSAALSATDKNTISASADATAANASKNVAATAPKDNTVLWKGYMDSVISALKTEALPSKKIKHGTYYATVSYTIGTDGQVTVGDIFLTPESAYLQQQIKERLTLNPPTLNPVLNSSGTPRKVTKKYNFTLAKD